MTDQEADYRKQYGIREATASELALMTPEQRWHYDAAAHKPHGLHFEFFRHEGKPVAPVYLRMDGRIEAHLGFIPGDCAPRQAALRPLPIKTVAS